MPLPFVANVPPQTTAQIADEKFFAKSKNANAVFESKFLSSLNSIIPMQKFPLPPSGAIDTAISFNTGGWRGAFYLKGVASDSGTIIYASYLEMNFTFRDGYLIGKDSIEFSAAALAWLGVMEDAESIKMIPKVIDANKKLTMTLTAIDTMSKVRKLVFEDGKRLQVYYNDGTMEEDESCIVNLLDVSRRGMGVLDFTLRLTKDFGTTKGVLVNKESPLTYPPNLKLWIETEGELGPLNYLDIFVQDTINFALATYDATSKKYNYSKVQATQVLVIKPTQGYRYSFGDYFVFDPFYAVDKYNGMLEGAIYELGIPIVDEKRGRMRLPRGYYKCKENGMLDSLDGLPVYRLSSEDHYHYPARLPVILIGDSTGYREQLDKIGANFFAVMEPDSINDYETRVLIRKGEGGVSGWVRGLIAFSDIDGVICLRFNSLNGRGTKDPYYLKNGKMDYANFSRPGVTVAVVETTGYGTDTIYANNQRVVVLDNRHIRIIDNNKVSWGGERYYMINGVLAPYDTAKPVGVNERPEIISPSIEIAPNPASDEITITLNNPANQDTKLYLYTPLGQQLGEIEIKAGERAASISTKSLPEGIIWITDRKNGLPIAIIK
jgi:hypothetical protein